MELPAEAPGLCFPGRSTTSDDSYAALDVTQGGGVGDGQQVRVLGLDVAGQRLDPALVLNGTISKAA